MIIIGKRGRVTAARLDALERRLAYLFRLMAEAAEAAEAAGLPGEQFRTAAAASADTGRTRRERIAEIGLYVVR